MFHLITCLQQGEQPDSTLERVIVTTRRNDEKAR
jgi:hypothetical protein